MAARRNSYNLTLRNVARVRASRGRLGQGAGPCRDVAAARGGAPVGAADSRYFALTRAARALAGRRGGARPADAVAAGGFRRRHRVLFFGRARAGLGGGGGGR